MQDEGDTLAGAMITCLLPHHSGDEKWFESLIAGSKEALALWAKDPVFTGLSEAGKEIQFKTPLEALQTAIDRVGLPRIVKSWSNPRRRMNNLGKLLGLCVQYMDQCKARRSAATVSGFIIYLGEAEAGQAESFGPQTVQLLTYHGAKGLEWPVVILSSLDTKPRASLFESRVIPSPAFDPKDPLANRSLCFWPWPFGAQKTFPELEDRVSAMQAEVEQQAAEEERRLLYVGMTRARDRMIFAARYKNGLKTAWLDSLSGNSDAPLIEWPGGADRVKAGDEYFPVTVKDINPPEESDYKGTLPEEKYYLPAEAKDVPPWPSAFFAPSSLEADEDLLFRIIVEDAVDFKIRIPLKTAFTTRGDGYADLGNAIHGFFAVDAGKQPREQQIEIMRRLLSRWKVEDAALPEDIINAGARLRSWLDSRYPGAKILKEWPISLKKENYQRVQGWIDLLLDLPEGYVIVDHKTTPNMEREHAKTYAPQLFVYREAVEHATGRKVLATFIHMPVCGLIVEVKA
jgi:ATP-dependent exoDNAse (exonuclease V) beta subunit